MERRMLSAHLPRDNRSSSVSNCNASSRSILCPVEIDDCLILEELIRVTFPYPLSGIHPAMLERLYVADRSESIMRHRCLLQFLQSDVHLPECAAPSGHVRHKPALQAR